MIFIRNNVILYHNYVRQWEGINNYKPNYNINEKYLINWILFVMIFSSCVESTEIKVLPKSRII